MSNPWISPVGHLKIRSDPAGDGHFGAKRGPRRHNGIDLVVVFEQPILAPTDCHFERISNPYADDARWHGVLLFAKQYEIFLWYMRPYWFRVGETVFRGEELGIAQDVAEKYGPPMTPHLHMGVKEKGEWIDPLPLLSE